MRTIFNPGEKVYYRSLVTKELKQGQIEKISVDMIYHRDTKKIVYNRYYFLFHVAKAFFEKDLKKIGNE